MIRNHSAWSHWRALPVLLGALTLISVQPHDRSYARSDPATKPAPVSPARPDASTRSTPPLPGSKNAIEPPAADPSGVTQFRADGPANAAMSDLAAQNAGWLSTTCGASADGRWTTNSFAFQPIRACTLNAPQDGWAFVSASGSVGLPRNGYAYEGRFRLGVDDPGGDTTTDRWVNIYGDEKNGSDKTIATSTIVPIRAGAHTFSFLGASASLFGTVEVIDPMISVMYVPGTSVDIQTCEQSAGNDWTTAAETPQVIASCTLNAPQAGYAFVVGSASAHLPNGSPEYEARFRLGVNNSNGSPLSDRWVNIYGDNGDGTDETVATSLLAPVNAGANTFSFLGYRYKGNGTVQLLDPTISVIYLRATAVTAKTCSAATETPWSSTAENYTPIVKCSLTAPRSGWALIDVSASVGLSGNGAGEPWEGRFRVGVDNTNGSAATDRFVNVYRDIGDGTDKVIAATWLASVNRGSRAFSFAAQRSDGAGSMRVYSPSITVIVPGATLFLPVSGK